MSDKVLARALFVGAEYRTALWVSDEVLDAFLEFQANKKRLRETPAAMVLNKLELYARGGFDRNEGTRGEPIRPEPRQTHRIGHRHSLYRIYGFYEDVTKKAFIALATNLKKGGKLSAQDRELLNWVADIRDNGLWEKAR